ncbi:hypothetical protein SAY86_017582 [Trapa natans]|uniref:Uncharacterized protein n=1 Tax=Trapa natans TaxID=22666 RepID=A0AAN7R8Y7_TRANT|nr:hypothetical protein SAY86_017582 [Trapa natans]
MPQVDLEALVSACAGGSCDSKIACETVAAEERPLPDDLDSDLDSDAEVQEVIPHDLPPESFWLSKDAEFDWFDRNAFYERKDSKRGNSFNSTSLNPSLNFNSQRFAANRKSKALIIGLPKPQKTSFVDPKNRRTCKAGNTRLFPKRSGSIGKSDPPMIEPSSPKVSCMGRVRSKKDRNRKQKSRQKSKSPETEPVKTAKPPGMRKAGLLSSFRSLFRSGRKSRRDSEHNAPGDPPSRTRRRLSAAAATSVSHDITERLPARDVHAPSSESIPRRSMTESEPPGLGSMARFSSGRRSDAWGDDLL